MIWSHVSRVWMKQRIIDEKSPIKPGRFDNVFPEVNAIS